MGVRRRGVLESRWPVVIKAHTVCTVKWLLKVGHVFVEGNNIRLTHTKLPFLKAKIG